MCNEGRAGGRIWIIASYFIFVQLALQSARTPILKVAGQAPGAVRPSAGHARCLVPTGALQNYDPDTGRCVLGTETCDLSD